VTSLLDCKDHHCYPFLKAEAAEYSSCSNVLIAEIRTLIQMAPIPPLDLFPVGVLEENLLTVVSEAESEGDTVD